MSSDGARGHEPKASGRWARVVDKVKAARPASTLPARQASPGVRSSPSQPDTSAALPDGVGDARPVAGEASSGAGSTDEADDEDDCRPARAPLTSPGSSQPRRTSTLLPVLRLPLYRPSSRIDGSATAKPRSTAASSGSHFYDTPNTAMPPEAPAVIRTRQHLRVRVVTWNMHDQLPMGDLSDLLGTIPDAAYETANASVGSWGRVPQLGEALEADGLYHIIVVGGQEAPGGGVTAGGVTVPTTGLSSGAQWIDVIDGYLARGDLDSARQPRLRQHSGQGHEMLHSASTTSTASVPTPSSTHGSPFAATKGPPPSGGRGAAPLAPIPGSIIRRDYATTEADEHGMSPPLATPGLDASKPLPPLPTIRPRGSVDSLRSNKSFDVPATPARTGAAVTQTSPAPTGPYVLVAKERLMGIFACVYVLRSCRALVGGFDKGKVTTGLVGGRVGNKGCAAISLKFAGQRMLFVVAHLAAHTGGLPLRMGNVLKIKDELIVDDFTASPGALRRSGTSHALPTKHSSRSSGGPLRDITSQFDYTIWLGDLNFRTAISRLHADWLLQKRDYATMLQFDELRNLMAGPDNVFPGFIEAPISFPPTYKYDVLALRKKPTMRRATSTRGLRRSNTASSVPMVNGPSTTSESDAAASMPSDSAPVSSRASFSSTASERAEFVENLSATVTTTPKVMVSPVADDAPPTPSPLARSRARFFGANRTQSSSTVVPRPPPLSLNTSAASSVTSLDIGAEPSSPNRLQALRTGDEDAIFDSSKKQRVQSWTDRILVRSTVAQPGPPEAEPASLQRRLGSLVDSLKLGASSRRSISGSSPLSGPARRPSSDGLGLGRIASAQSDASGGSARSGLGRFGLGARLRAARSRRDEERPAPAPRRRESEVSPVQISPTLQPHAPPTTPVTPVRLVARPTPSGLKLVAEPKRPSTSPSAPAVRRMSGAEAEQLISPAGSRPPSPKPGRPRAQSDSHARVVFTPASPTREPSDSAVSPSFLRPQRSRSSVNHSASDNPFSFRTWWSQHVPAAFAFSSSAIEDDAEPVRASAQRSDAPTWIGPQRGEVLTLKYSSVNDLRKLGAQSDHRPVVGVFAFGLGGDEDD